MGNENEPPRHDELPIDLSNYTRRSNRERIRPEILYDHEVATSLIDQWSHPAYRRQDLVEVILRDTTPPEKILSIKDEWKQRAALLLDSVPAIVTIDHPALNELSAFAAILEVGSPPHEAIVRLLKLQIQLCKLYGSNAESKSLVLKDKILRDLASQS
jgi:hypothetical protein